MLSLPGPNLSVKCIHPFLDLTSVFLSGEAVFSLSLGLDHDPGSHGTGFICAKGRNIKWKINPFKMVFKKSSHLFRMLAVAWCFCNSTCYSCTHGYPRLTLKIRRALALKMCALVFPVKSRTTAAEQLSPQTLFSSS